MIKTYGRVDYKPRLKLWRAYWYTNDRDNYNERIGDYSTQLEANNALQNRIKMENVK